MTAYKLYIGSNNSTKRVELDKIERTLNKFYDGYTIEKAVGYWLGTRENSVVITVTTPEPKLKDAIQQLKTILKQDAIAYQLTAPLEFI